MTFNGREFLLSLRCATLVVLLIMLIDLGVDPKRKKKKNYLILFILHFKKKIQVWDESLLIESDISDSTQCSGKHKIVNHSLHF